MEALINAVVSYVISLADTHQYLAVVCIVIGALYVALTALRSVLTAVVKMTKTQVDDNVIGAVFAFLDKFAYGFGKFAEYFEKKKPKF